MKKLSFSALWFLLRHSLFWFAVWFGLALFFSTISWKLNIIDLWYAAFFLPGLMVMVYICRQFLVPLFGRKNKPIAFFLIGIGLVTSLGVFIHKGIQTWIGDGILTQYYFGEYNEAASIIVHTLVLTIALGLHFSRAWYIQQTKIRDIQEARLKSEIRLLRSQLEPHFLFNSLNSLYALSLRQDPRAPQAILELSELLRYLQLASGKEAVSLDEEWAFLEKYKNIQALRLNDRVRLSFESEGRLIGQTIAPLLMLNLVENAFKHFAPLSDGTGVVDIFLLLKNEKLQLKVQNSYKPEGGVKKASTGLRHLQKQLHIHYPNKHSLSIQPGIDLFLCELSIDLSE